MDVATSEDGPTSVEVGVRELRNELSRYLRDVRHGVEVVVTDRGRPVARLTGVDAATDHLAELVAAGIVRPPRAPGRRPAGPRVAPRGSVSDLVAEQRR